MKKIFIVGDIMQHDIQHEAGQMFSKKLKDLIITGDAVIGNLETLIDHKLPKSGFPYFNSDISFVEQLANIGFTDLIVTNNHSKDFSYQSWLNTIQNVEGCGIRTHGASSRMRELKNITGICIRSGSDRFNKNFEDEDYLSNQEKLPVDKKAFIASLHWQKQLFKTNGFHPLVQPEFINYFHCGKEYFHDMSSDQLEMYSIISKLKTEKDIATIFSHSHVIGSKNVRNDELMKFESSLGNFCSFQESLEKQLGLIIEYEFDEYHRTLKFKQEYAVETTFIDNRMMTDFAEL